MTNGLTWIGAHAHTATPVPGMLSGISLTLARGIEPDEFLINLGADLDQLAARTPLAELRSQPTQASERAAFFSSAPPVWVQWSYRRPPRHCRSCSSRRIVSTRLSPYPVG
ncbi:hypothetical protein ABT368_33625 [Streptomyces althioticus]|uniref:hypothetical protein n=1 Tax=Streptomyces althioticus TaxID=83380 RepID=UPI00331E0C70